MPETALRLTSGIRMHKTVCHNQKLIAHKMSFTKPETFRQLMVFGRWMFFNKLLAGWIVIKLAFIIFCFQIVLISFLNSSWPTNDSHRSDVLTLTSYTLCLKSYVLRLKSNSPQISTLIICRTKWFSRILTVVFHIFVCILTTVNWVIRRSSWFL